MYLDCLIPIILQSQITDHYCILLIDKDNIVNNNKTHTIQSKYLDVKTFMYILKEKNWEIVINEPEVNKCANKFHDILNNYLNNTIKTKIITIHQLIEK